MTTITHVEAHDVRFPTSRSLDGSDAMNPDPDYSGAWAILRTDDEALSGHGLTFTIGRGTELCTAALRSLAPLVEGLTLEEFAADPGAIWRRLVGDSQLRWLGPEKGVVHLATAALVNALWDLWARAEGKPVWELVASLSPERLLGCLDLRHVTDCLSPDEALQILRDAEPGKAARVAEMKRDGYPAYTTSAGWLGYSDDKIQQLCRDGIANGWSRFKIKVGRDLDDDIRRCTLVRDEIGAQRMLMVDANQVWEVRQAIDWMARLAEFEPGWCEEPTSPDDVLGHAAIARAIAPIPVATGEHCQNRVIWKQLLAAGACQVAQVDACRLGGLNEVLVVLLLAAKYHVPVCPHAGGVGLCELVQHISLIDYVCVSGSLDGRVTEYAGHLHEHFTDPVEIRGGRYVAPSKPGFSAELLPDSLAAHRFPDGSVWAG